MYSDPQQAFATPLAASPKTAPAPWLLRIQPDKELCEASVLRQLGRAGVSVRQRSWGPATIKGGAPELVLRLDAATQAQALQAAEQLRQGTGAQVLCCQGTKV